MRIPGADSWVQEDRWEARGSMPGSYGLPTITDDQGGHIAYVASAEHAKVLAAALDLFDAARILYGLTSKLDLTPTDADDVETGRRQVLRAMRKAGFGA
jgi:hypothetical protein